MKNRTYIADVVSGMNLSVFGFVVGYSEPKKTNGSDYQMYISIMDESSRQKASVLLFLGSEDEFPKHIIEKETVIKIENLNLKEKNSRPLYLVDRKKGCFFFEVKREKISYTPYFSCNNMAYKEGPSDREAIVNIHAHFYNEMPTGPKMISTIVKIDSIFTVYGYIKEIITSSAMTTLIMCDPSTDKELRVRIWKREPENFPEKNSSICIYNIKVKRIDQGSITADVSKSMNLTWTDKIPKDVQLLFNAHRIINSKNFIDTVVNKINMLNDRLESPAQALESILKARYSEKNSYDTKEKATIRKDKGPAKGQKKSMNEKEDSFSDIIQTDREKEELEENISGSNGPTKRPSTEKALLSKKPPIKKLSIDASPNEKKEKELTEEDIQTRQNLNIPPCQPKQSFSNLSQWKRLFFSFKETDLIYDELIQLPIKAYHTNPSTNTVSFDKVALLMLDKVDHASESDTVITQNIAFYKKTPIIFHMCRRSSSTSPEIAGYVFVFKNLPPAPVDSKTLHVLLYRSFE